MVLLHHCPLPMFEWPNVLIFIFLTLLAKYSIYTYYLPLSWICLNLRCFFAFYHGKSPFNSPSFVRTWNLELFRSTDEANPSYETSWEVMLEVNSCSYAVTGLYPIGSMYGIFTYIWLIFMVNVSIPLITSLWILRVPNIQISSPFDAPKILTKRLRSW